LGLLDIDQIGFLTWKLFGEKIRCGLERKYEIILIVMNEMIFIIKSRRGKRWPL
jgi:hypothetical protein